MLKRGLLSAVRNGQKERSVHTAIHAELVLDETQGAEAESYYGGQNPTISGNEIR